MMLGFLTAQIVAHGVPQDVNLGDFSNKVMSTTKLIDPKLDVTSPFRTGEEVHHQNFLQLALNMPRKCDEGSPLQLDFGGLRELAGNVD